MSDSELSDAPSNATPSDSELGKSLRAELKKAASRSDEYSVTSVREASEKSLGLPAGFYKNHATWKAKSKEIITTESNKLNSTADDNSPNTKAKPANRAKSVKAEISAKKDTAPKRPAKRKQVGESPAPRKKKKAPVEEDSDELSSPLSDTTDDVSDDEEEEFTTAKKNVSKKGSSKQAVKSKPNPKRNSSTGSSSELSDVESNEAAAKKDSASIKDDGNSDSEMSVVLDDQPAKKRGKSKDEPEEKSKKAKTTKAKAGEAADADKEEIKKLQGWLVKCGVRKVWGKELKPYETSKAKVKHLKSLLSDVGMDGRFSNEKAAAIKEARELAADIEAVQEGAQRWGKSDGEDDDGDTKTRGGRRLIRGAQNYAFLSSDGEETD